MKKIDVAVLDRLSKDVYWWFNRFPIDKWWREKHNIPFGSKLHKEVSYADMVFEYIEDYLYEEALNSKSENYIDPETQKAFDEIEIQDLGADFFNKANINIKKED